MKRLLLLLLLASTVSANMGYVPITIFEGGRYSYAYCRFGEPCKYLEGKVLVEGREKGSFDLPPNAGYYVLGGVLLSVVIVVGLSYRVASWAKPK